MATLKAISIRLKSVKNIQKITQSMKMVSAAKYTRAERELRMARPIGEGAQVSWFIVIAWSEYFHKHFRILCAVSFSPKAFYEKAEVASPEAEKPQKLIIAITSDRGLCGAVHSSVARNIKNELATDGENTKVICVGDKSRGILQM